MTRQAEVYDRYTGHLCMTINKFQNSLIYLAFSQLVWKTCTKDLSQIEKDKVNKKGFVQKSSQKRSDQISDIRKKIHNMKGQVEEGRIELYKKKTDGSRSYGINTIRKAE